jgi:hypothetical protein
MSEGWWTPGPAMQRPSNEECLLAVKLRKATTHKAIIDLLTTHIGSDVVRRAVEGAIDNLEEAERETEWMRQLDEDEED